MAGIRQTIHLASEDDDSVGRQPRAVDHRVYQSTRERRLRWVTSGPLSDFAGEIIDVDGVERKLKVRVDIFDRQIPVELDLDQVEKLDEI
jgi:hypothetical protein